MEKGWRREKNQMDKLALFQLCNHLLQCIMRELAGVFIEDCLRGLGWWRVEKNYCCHVFSERLRDARELLSQHPHTDAGMVSRKSELDKLPSLAFHIFWWGAVIKHNGSVGAFERGGEAKIVLDDGSGLRKDFLNATFVKKALGESFEELQRKENEEVYRERQRLIQTEKQKNGRGWAWKTKSNYEKKTRNRKNTKWVHFSLRGKNKSYRFW